MASLRRDFLILAGGAGAGLALSPLPWNIVRDSALWSQNWSWIPKTPRGEISYKPTSCELCPAGCAVRARLAGAQPVSLWAAPKGEKTEPLCPAGLCAHHLAFHPARLRKHLHEARECGSAEAATTASRLIGQAPPESIAVLDLRPGRTASLLYRKHLAKLGGRYLTLTPTLGATLQSVADLVAGDSIPAFDLNNTGILLSIGTPVFEAWGAPGRMLNPARKFRVWHAEALESGTAIAADRWFRIRPGSETAFAAGLVAALDGDQATLKDAARITGIDANDLAGAARQLAAQNSVAVSDPHPVLGPPEYETLRAVACLNGRLKAFGRPGGIVGRRRTPVPKGWGDPAVEQRFASVADGSLRFLFIDDSAPGAPLPWKMIAAKLAPGAVVVTASWTGAGLARQSTYALPAVTCLEGLHDVAASPDLAEARFALAPPLAEPPQGAVEPVEWFGKLAGDETSLADRLKERAQAIRTSQNGGMRSEAGEVYGMGTLKTDDDFWNALLAGSRWQDESKALPLRVSNLPQPPRVLHESTPGMEVAAQAWWGADVSPLMSKLWVESDLHPHPLQVGLNPVTASRLALTPGSKARIVNAHGECAVEVAIDATVPPDVLRLAAGQAWFALCNPVDGAWRAEAHKVVKA